MRGAQERFGYLFEIGVAVARAVVVNYCGRKAPSPWKGGYNSTGGCHGSYEAKGRVELEAHHQECEAQEHDQGPHQPLTRQWMAQDVRGPVFRPARFVARRRRGPARLDTAADP